MPKQKVNDIEMYYEIHGKGEPVVFVSGFTCDHTIWLNILEDFAAKYQVILFDNRGIGQTDASNMPYTIEMMSDDTIGLCKALGIHSAHFVGSSMGGMVLQDIAYRYPAFVKSVVIENSGMKTDVKFLIYTKGNVELMKSNASLKALSKIVAPWIFSSNFLEKEGALDNFIQMNLEDPYPVSVETYENQCNALAKFNSCSWISKIKSPCFITGADEDRIFAEAEQRLMAEKIHNAIYHCFQRVGHVPHLEQPKKFSELVLEFLSSQR